MPGPLGRYQLGELLASGGMAELYRATRRGVHDFQKEVAVKRILPHLAADERFVEMFVDEARLVSRLSHPKIVQVYELGSHAGQLFIAMELVDGIDVLELLRARVKLEKRLPPDLAGHIAHEVLDALDYAHNATSESGAPLEIVHRDISPGNVLLSRSGEVKLTDFGVARAREKLHTTQAGTLKGKYAYMSPEQASGFPVDRRSDLFSVGILLAELLMNRRLFAAPDDVALITMVRGADLRRLEKHGGHIDPSLRALLARALDRDPWQRYQSARDFRNDLANWLAQRDRRTSRSDVADAVADAIEVHRRRPHPVRPPSVTLSGNTTKMDRIRAEEAAAIARQSFAASVAEDVAELPPLELVDAHDFSQLGARAGESAPTPAPPSMPEALDLLPASAPLGGEEAVKKPPPPPPPGRARRVPTVEEPLAPRPARRAGRAPGRGRAPRRRGRLRDHIADPGSVCPRARTRDRADHRGAGRDRQGPVPGRGQPRLRQLDRPPRATR